MAARLNKRHSQFYVYQFFDKDVCVYVGKGCGDRFKKQKKNFKEFKGEIIKYFDDEQQSLDYERMLIKKLSPSFNKKLNDRNCEPWKYRLVPEKDSDFSAWCLAVGSQQMAGRILLAKPWSILKRYGVDIQALLNKVKYNGVYYGSRC